MAGAHSTRGCIGEFGAPRSGGRTHEGFDLVARCGTPLVAAANGRVRRVGYDPVLYGHYVTIGGAGEGRSYFYAHMPPPNCIKFQLRRSWNLMQFGYWRSRSYSTVGSPTAPVLS